MTRHHLTLWKMSDTPSNWLSPSELFCDKHLHEHPPLFCSPYLIYLLTSYLLLVCFGGAGWEGAEIHLRRHPASTGQAFDPICRLGRIQGFLLQNVRLFRPSPQRFTFTLLLSESRCSPPFAKQTRRTWNRWRSPSNPQLNATFSGYASFWETICSAELWLQTMHCLCSKHWLGFRLPVFIFCCRASRGKRVTATLKFNSSSNLQKSLSFCFPHNAQQHGWQQIRVDQWGDRSIPQSHSWTNIFKTIIPDYQLAKLHVSRATTAL